MNKNIVVSQIPYSLVLPTLHQWHAMYKTASSSNKLLEHAMLNAESTGRSWGRWAGAIAKPFVGKGHGELEKPRKG